MLREAGMLELSLFMHRYSNCEHIECSIIRSELRHFFFVLGAAAEAKAEGAVFDSAWRL